MITLTGQMTFERFNVYRDDVNPLQFYYMPEGPRIALDENGDPMFSLIMYRRDLSAVPMADQITKLGGGILALSVELSATDDEKARMRDMLADDPITQAAYSSTTRSPFGRFWELRGTATAVDKAKVAQALVLGMVPVDSGTVTIQIAAEDGSQLDLDPEFVAKGGLAGAGSVSMTGNERASFMAKLTMYGAALVWTAIEKDLKVIRVAYELNFNYRVVGLVVDAWCDAHKAFTALQNQIASMSEQGQFVDDGGDHTFGHSQSTTLTDVIQQSMTSGEFSGVTVTPSAPSDVIKPEYIQQVEQGAQDQIKQFIADTFTDYKPGSDVKTDDKDPDIQTELPSIGDKKYGGDYVGYYKLKTWDESMSATFHYHLSEQTVLPFKLAPNDNMSNLLNGQNVERFRTEITLDPAFYKYLDVMTVCTADFDNDPINDVKAHLSYSAQGPQGPINQINDFLFQKGGAPQQHFATYIAGVDKQTYNYEYEIHYKGPTDKYSVSGQTNETILILDADQLGIIKVNVQLGIIDWDQIRQVVVNMSYGVGSSQKATEFMLDSTHQSYRWVEVIGKPVTDPYTWSATFVDKDNQRLLVPPKQQRGALVIDQPIGESLSVTFVAVGTFGGPAGILEILVAPEYLDPANNYSQIPPALKFQKEGDVQVWKFPLVNNDLRTFHYETQVLRPGGIFHTVESRNIKDTIVLVGDPYDFKVTVLPYLLKGTPWMFGTLKLTFDDPQTNIHAENVLEVRDYATPLTWPFRLGAPERHTFQYQLTLFQADSTSFSGPVTPYSEEVLVLRPPPATTPH